MAQLTSDDAPSVAPPHRPPGLMVLPLRAAEQHVLVVIGEADLHTAESLRVQIVELLWSEPASVLVELGALEFCDLHGLSALYDVARAADEAGIVLSFRGMSAQLRWLASTFPPRDPQPGLPQALLNDGAALRSGPGPGTSGARSTTHPPTASPEPPASPDPGRPAGGGPPRRSRHAPNSYLSARGGGRKQVGDALAHAVPVSDTTRSAVCGVRVWPARQAWTDAGPDRCPDCVQRVQRTSGVVGTVHNLPAPTCADNRVQRQPDMRRVS